MLSIHIMILLILSAHFVTAQTNSDVVESHDFANAMWIGAEDGSPLKDEDHYKDNPAPIFRKEFVVEDDIQSATLSITAAGYYKALLNGEKIGKNYLDPAWTDFSRRIYYTEYDLTTNIKHGDNCIGVTLGNGFYNPLPMKMWGHLNIRNYLPVGEPVFIARLVIEYADGQTEEIITDSSWKYSHGPIRKNNVYIGEVYDAGYEIDGWNLPGFDDSKWNESVIDDGPGGILQKSFFPPVRQTGRIIPVSVKPADNGVYMVDMGENFTGLYRIHLTGEPGDTITFRFGERIYNNGALNPMTTVAGQIKEAGRGGPGAPDVAWQEDKYIFGYESDIWYTPEFTFHTYRYMEISGLKTEPLISDIEGIALNSNVDKGGSFSCSSELINSIQDAVERTFLANLISVQSDCPAREKFGYGGDLNATSEAFIYNFDMQEFYRKTIYDWVDAINDSVFVDTAPYVGINYCGLSWESAFLTTQYNLYLYYNDTALVKELYELDLDWMDKAERLHPEGIVDAGLSDHESLEPVPVELTGTSHYLQCARIMETFASIMGDAENEEKFGKLADRLEGILLERFWNNSVPGPINRQTLFASLLYHNIIPDYEVSAAIDSLINALLKAPSSHFTTGIFGTKYILEALSKYGRTESVYDIVNSKQFPGWGHMIDRGATTIWETWKESDNVYSNCHPMFGSVTEWFYRWLGGIRPDPDYPGFEKFIINPSLPKSLSGVHTSYNSPYGKIVSNWTNYGKDKQVYEISVPEGSRAEVKLQATEEQKIAVVDNSSDIEFTPDRGKRNNGMFELSAGEYTITVYSVRK